MNRAIIPDRKTTNGLSLFNIEDNSSNVTTDSNNSSSNVTTDSNSSSDIDLNLNNYINGLVVYGNLIVYGTLYILTEK